MFPAIVTPRLDLVLLSPDFLRSTVEGQHGNAEAILGARIPADWWACAEFAALRLRNCEADPKLRPWLPRGMVERETGTLVGFIGFHTAPGAAYLQTLSPEAVEFGYEVFPAYRRRGYAEEACRALMTWAHATHGVRAFIVSVSPSNHASLRLVTKLGFRKISSHIDEVDGPEDIFERIEPAEPTLAVTPGLKPRA